MRLALIRRPTGGLAVLVLFLGVQSLAGCVSTDASTARRSAPTMKQPRSENATSSSTSTARGTAAPAPETIPARRSELPDGVYRTRIAVDELIARAVDDLSGAGEWTLVVRAGSFTIECRPVGNSGSDCGNAGSSALATVERGQLRGTGATVWFVHDMAAQARLSGCVRHSEAANGCGPEDPYRLTWQKAPGGLRFSAFVGLGDQGGRATAYSNMTIKPWTKIA